MARTSYYPQKYKCNRCHTIQQHYVWSNEVDTKNHVCENDWCKTPITPKEIHIEEITPVFAIKMSGEQVRSERLQRSRTDFQKNVRPSFEKGSDEARHFDKK